MPRTEQSVALTVVVDRFLDRFRDDPTTWNTYAEPLTRLRAVAGDRLPTAELTPESYEQLMDRCTERAANKRGAGGGRGGNQDGGRAGCRRLGCLPRPGGRWRAVTVTPLQTCGQGTVTLTRNGSALSFAFAPATPGGPGVEGTLSRQ